MKILVLGAGRMGLGVAYDLAHNSSADIVTVADLDFERARAVVSTVNSSKLEPAQIDVSSQSQVEALMGGHDAAISCVTYYHNLRLAQAAIAARVNFCDLGGNNTVVDAELALDDQAQAAGINIIPDCGLAPGMVSVLAAHGAARFSSLSEIHIRVGGLPQKPKPPFDYQLIFSVEGLINEYVERARVIRGGEIIEVDSMTELERLEFPHPFGQMEAFQTSGGTSTLPESFLGRVSDLDYKTIRLPGHCEKFKTMIDLGLSSRDPIDVDGVHITPRRVLAELLARHLPADEPDAVLVRLEFQGIAEGKTRTLRYDIIDYFDEKTGLSAMMRTTAFPASIIAQMMARGETLMKGATPQERCIPPDKFVAELSKRNIRITESLLHEE
jgi:lysine 6-dehydrogenase